MSQAQWDALSRVKNAVDGELALRQMTEFERIRGNNDGPMNRAHQAQIQECVAAAQNLLDVVNGTD